MTRNSTINRHRIRDALTRLGVGKVYQLPERFRVVHDMEPGPCSGCHFNGGHSQGCMWVDETRLSFDLRNCDRRIFIKVDALDEHKAYQTMAKMGL